MTQIRAWHDNVLGAVLDMTHSSAKTPSSQPPSSRPPRWATLAVVVVALAVRGGVVGAMPEGLKLDPDGYRGLAENLVEHGTFGRGDVPTAYRPPLYPLLLAPCVFLGANTPAAIGVLHVILGVATAAVVFRLAWDIGLGLAAAGVTAMVAACDPILLGQSVVVMTETPAALLTALTLWSLTRTVRRPTALGAAATGATAALAGLCRPELLLWFAACVPMLWVMLGSEMPGPWTRRLRVAGSMLAAAAVVLTPWAVRNAVQLGRPIVTTTHGGYTLLLANNPAFFDFAAHGAWGEVWDARELGPEFGGHAQHACPSDERQFDRRAYDLAWGHIAAQPELFAWSCVVRAGRFWAIVPHQGSRTVRAAVAGWYLVVFSLAGWGVWGTARTCHDPGGIWVWSLLLVVILTGVHAVYWSDMRMRAPLVPAIALAAAAGLIGKRPGGEEPKSKQEHDLDAPLGP